MTVRRTQKTLRYRERAVACFKALATGDAIGKQTEMLSHPDVTARAALEAPQALPVEYALDHGWSRNDALGPSKHVSAERPASLGKIADDRSHLSRAARNSREGRSTSRLLTLRD